jgi:autotransporter-associated beta strand protein
MGAIAPTTAASSSSTTLTVASTAGLKPGMWVNGPGVGYGDYIVSITNGTQFVISAARTVASGASLQFGGIAMSNGGIFAADPDAGLTLSQPLTINNNTTSVFAGSGNITLDGALRLTAGNNPVTISNNLENGAILTINSDLTNFKTDNQTLFLRGYGSTVWNGNIANAVNGTTTTAFDVRVHPSATLTMGGTPNTFGGTFTLGQGTLILNKKLTTAVAPGQFNFLGGVLHAGIALTGANAINNNIHLVGDPSTFAGTNNIEVTGSLTNNAADRRLVNNLTGGATLTFAGQVNLSEHATTGRTFTFQGSGSTILNGAVTNGAGTGASALRMEGTGTLRLTNQGTFTGATTVNNGTLVLSGTNGRLGGNTTAAVNINSPGNVTLDNVATNPGTANRLNAKPIVSSGGTLNLIGNAAGSAESIGALTINSSPFRVNVTDNTGGLGSNTLTFASVNIANSGSALDLSSISGLGSLNKVLFTTSTGLGAVNGLLPKVYINGSNDFAAYDATNGVVPFTAYNNSNNLDTAAATDTLNITGAVTQTANRTINAMRLNGTGLTVGAPGRTITLTTGALISTGAGTNTLDGALAIGNQAHFQVAAGNTLDVIGSIIGANTLAKAGAGTMIFSNRQYFTSTLNVLNGTLKLDGGLNTIYAPAAGAFFNSAPGSTLDLNGNVQGINALASPAAAPGGGGNIISSSGTGTLVGYTGGTFGGVVSGQINYARMGGGTQTMSNANTYSGWTLLGGGTTTLRDDATLLNTSAFDINFATLFLDNNANLQRGINNRVNDAALVTLRGGTITYNGVVGEIASERFGALSVLMGANELRSTTNYGSSTFASADLVFTGGLTRTPGATINFTSNVQLGTGGNNARILFDAPIPTVANGALGAWAIANTTDFAAYNSGNGVGVVGTGGYVGYSENFGSGNITNLGATSIAGENSTALTAASTSTALLRLARQSYQELTFSSGTNILNLEEGGLLRENNAFAAVIGTPANRGILTAGGTESSGIREMVFYSGTAGSPTFFAPNTGGVIALGSPNVTLSSTVGLLPGMNINHASFPAGTTVVSVNGLTSVTLSNNATVAAQNTSLTTDTLRAGAATSGSPVVSVNSTVGVRPGMTLTGSGIPAGSYVVSVDSPTQLTLSQNATATNSGQNFTAGMGNIIVNSVIADNGFGNSVQFIKSGAGVFNLSGNNTYTGGTIINQGTVNLIGSGVVIPAGGITLSGGSLVMNTNAGQIDAGNAVTLNGSSTMTLAGNNTLFGLTFSNTGGATNPTVNSGGILTLTSMTPISASSSNPATFSTVNGILNLGSGGTRTIDVGAIEHNGVLLTDSLQTLILNASLQGIGVAIDKTGSGLVEFGGQSTFDGGLNVAAGGIVVGSSSNGTATGPLGTGAVTFASGTTLWVDNASRTVNNDITFAANPTLGNTGTTTSTLTLNGALTFNTLNTTGAVLNLPTPYLNVILGGEIVNAATITSIGGTGANSISKTGLGNITGINLTGVNPAATINLDNLTTGAFSLLNDGDGSVRPENLSLGDIVTANTPNLIIGRSASTYLPIYTQALNKTLAPSSVNLDNGLTLTNANGYGLLVANAVALNATTAPVYNVSAASASNGVLGLNLTGQVTGGITGDVVFTKTGAGAMALSNSTNSFGGAGSIIDITAGILQVSSNGALGAAGNIVRLSTNNATQGLRLSGSSDFTLTGRTINLNAASNAIDVTGGITATIDTPFTYSAATNNLQKNDNGTLLITADNTGWTGITTLNGGILRVGDQTAIGSGGVSLTSIQGTAFQLTGGQDINRPININSGAGNIVIGGVNFGGQLDNFAGTNTWSGPVTTSVDASIGARTGTTLNLTGGIGMATATGRALYFNAEGNINVSGTAMANGAATSWHRIEKYGAGTLNLTTANTGLTFTGSANSAAVSVLGGTLKLSGAGTFNAAAWSTNAIFVTNGGSLELDNTATNIANRLTNGTPAAARGLILAGGSLYFRPNSGAASAESFGAFTSNWGNNRVLVDTTAQNSNLTFASLALGGGSTLVFESAGTGANFGTATNNAIFTAAPALTGGILTRVLVSDGNGVNFATSAGAAASITGYTAYNAGGTYTNINSAAAGDNVKAGTGFVTTTALTASRTINSLYLDGSTVTGPANSTLTLTSGGILANTGTSTLGNAGLTIALGAVEGAINVAPGATLNVDSTITNVGNVTKGLDGNLVFNARQRFNTAGNYFTINGGTVTLNAGTNTLFQGFQGGTFGQGLAVARGATLDLNGNSQVVGRLRSPNNIGLPGSGGIVTSATPAVFASVTTGEDSRWGGDISGPLGFVKAGSNTQFFYSDNTYTGSTLINGGGLTLTDSGRLSATNAIDLNYAALTLLNNGLSGSDDRVNDAATITLRGGNFSFTGRDNTNSIETIGDIILDQSQSILSVTLGGGNVRSSVLVTGNLTRNNYATLLYGGASGQLGSASRLIIANGSSLTVNGIIPWATDGGNFAGYETPSAGNTSGGLASVASAGYQGYDNSLFPAGLGSATQNIRLSSANFLVPSATTGADTYAANAVAFATSAANQTMSFADAADTLNLTSGGLLVSGNFTGKGIGSAVGNGRVTTGGIQSSGIAPLYFTVNQGTVNFNSSIVDNGFGASTRFVYTPFNAAVTNFLGANTYTGGTQLNGNASHTGTLALNVAGADGAGTVAIPEGDLEINQAVVRLDSSNQIHHSVSPLLNGGGILNLNNFSQTLTGLTINNNGHSNGAAVQIGTGTLTLNGNLTATSQNLGSVAAITGTGAGRLDLNGAMRVFYIDALTVLGDSAAGSLTPTLNITAVISGDASSGIQKTGTGLLQLSAANLYGGATELDGGTIRYGIANALPTATALDIATDATLDLNGFNATIGSLSGDAGSLLTNSALTGAVTLTTGGDNTSTTFAGIINHSNGSILNLIKTGSGTMILSGANTYSGRTSIQDGAISVASINRVVGGTSSSNLGTPLSAVNGTIDLGIGTTTGTLIYTGSGESTDRIINLAGTSGGGAIRNTGGGTFVLESGISAARGSKLLSITDGVVQFAGGSAVSLIPDNVGINLGNVAGTVLDLNGNAESFGSLSGGGVLGGNLLMTTGTLLLGGDNANAVFDGAINGNSTGGLTKIGGGMQTLNGATTFTGNVLIQSGNARSGGGLTLGGAASLAPTATVRNIGYNTTFGVNVSQTIGAYTATNNTILALGSGATLTSTYTNGTPTALAATADSAAANGRIIRQIDTSGLKPGDLISGTGVSAPGYIVQIIDATTVLVNRTPPTGPTNDFAPTVTSVSVVGSAMTGEGGFTKDGTGTLILTGNSTHTGATTINNGTLQIGGIWDGRKFALQDILSNSSRLVFAGTGTQTLQFADSTTNLLSFERVGSISGGAGNTTSIFLEAGSSRTVLALGGDNSTSTFTGRFMGPGGGEAMLIKEGTGNFTWSNADANVYDGPVYIENGTFTIAGTQGFDGSNEVWMSNRGATLNVTTTGGEVIPFLIGGAGSTRGAMPAAASGGTTSSGLVGATPGNFLTSVAPIVTLTTNLTLNEATAANIYTFNGDIQGAGILVKSGAHQFNLTGTSTNAHSGETQVTAGTLRMGVLSRSAGLGAASNSDVFGTLSTATGLRITGGILDLNGTSQTVTRINASSSGGTIALGNGSLTLSNQNTQTSGTGFTGNRNSVLNLNSSTPSILTLTGGGSSTFAGTVNIGTNAALTLNGVNFGDLSRINLNGTGTQLTLAVGDNIGSVAGTGSIVLTGSLGLLQAESGASSAPGFSGATSGAGGLNLSTFGGLTVSGALAHTGGIGLSNGSSLTLNYGSGSDILPAAGALTLNGGNVRIISTETTPGILESAASTTLNAGASSLRAFNALTGNVNTGLRGINLGTITRAVGGTIDIGRNAAATTGANVNGILGGTNTAYATLNGNTWAVANGGTSAISGLASYNADTFTAAQHTDITVAGPNAGGDAATIRFSGANAADITGTTTLSMGGILVTPSVGANTSTISGALSATGNELIIHQYNPLGDLVLSNVGGTNTAITTAGGGRTLITNNIAGTGTTTVGYGYLQLGDNTVGGSASGMVGSGTIRLDGTLGVNRSNSVTLGSIISGAGNLEQRGSGTTTLSAANTYLGRTSVLGGVLEITNVAGLGGTNFGLPNRWANLTSVNAGGTLRINVAVAGTDAATQVTAGTITEIINLDGGTLALSNSHSTGPFTNVATTLNAPLILSSDSTIHVGNTGASVNHLITGEILALPGADITVSGVATGTPSTLVLAPAATPGARWENTTIEANGRLQIGNNSRGWIGSGNIVNDGTLITNTNNGHLVLANNLSGGGSFIQARNTVYLTGDNSGYTGSWTVGSVAIANAGAELRVGNDTYTGSLGSGDVTIQATAASSLLRTHFIADTTIANNITLNATSTLNAHYLRQGIGNVALTGNLTIGANSAAAGRAILQTEGSGILSFDGTLVGGSATNLLNIVNNGIFRFGGSASHSYHGVLSGNNVWLYDNSGTTTLLGVNTVNSAHNYLRRGTLVVGTGGVNTINDDNDMQVFNGATLSVAGNETIGNLYMQRGAVTTINTGATLTVDDAGSQLIAGSIQGDGNLTLAGGNYMAMYGTNTATGILTLNNGGLQLKSATNAIGSFSSVILGAGANGGRLEYVGSGETYSGNITLAGTNTTANAGGSNRITANGNGALILSGNITATATNTLQLTGQTGGYFNPVKNEISGILGQSGGTLSLAVNPAVANDDRYGLSGRWALTNAANNFSGGITVNVGMLEFGGDLGTGGAVATSQLGALNVTRTFDLGTANFDGRRYDMFGSGDQIGAGAAGQGTNALAPNSGSVGSIIFNSTNAATFTVPSNITWTQSFSSTTNPGAGQIINDGAGAVVIQGNLTSGTNGNRSWILDGTNAGANTISGIISNGGSSTTALLKEGAGTWRISGVNTYTGATTINNGILEIAGGSAIADSATIAISGSGGDGLFSGVAKLLVVNSETIGLLTGNVLSEAEIAGGQTLTIGAAGTNTMNGMLSGLGGLTRTTAAGAAVMNASALNTYEGVTTIRATGTATGSATFAVWHLADGGSASGIGRSSNGAANLVFGTNTAGNQGGILQWQGYTNQSTDRLFTMGLGAAGARINASGTVVGTSTAPTLTFSNTDPIAFTGSGARTLILGGGTISDNTFRPQITDGGGATTLSKVDGGLWLVNPLAGNSYTGGTSITGGTLAIQAGNALGIGTITINGGGRDRSAAS